MMVLVLHCLVKDVRRGSVNCYRAGRMARGILGGLLELFPAFAKRLA